MSANTLNINTEGLVYYASNGKPTNIGGSQQGYIFVSNGPNTAPSFQSGGIITWIELVGGDQTLVANTAYFVPVDVVLTLPVGSLGDVIRLCGTSTSFSWVVDLGTNGCVLRMGNVTASTSATANGEGAVLELVCSAPSSWSVISSMGQFDLV